MSVLDSIRPASDGTWGISSRSSELMRQPPEPRSGAGTWLKVAGEVAQTVVSGALTGTSSFAAGGDFTSLLQQQIEIQKVMQEVSMASNIAKSQHETEMAPIRNMRVG